MPMICPDCRHNLDDVPLDDPCPECGGLRRSALIHATAALVGTSAVAGTVTIGYSIGPGWTYQWRSIQHHLTRLREQYQGVRPLGNLEVEATVHALFLDLYHLYDWLHQDRALPSLDEPTVRSFIDMHQNSLSLCRDYANTRKHMKRNKPNAPIAQITRIDSAPTGGYTVKIGYGPGSAPIAALTEIDALTLAERSELDWRDLLAQHHIAIPF